MSGPLVVVDTSVVIAHLTALSISTPSGRIMHACGAGSLRVALSDAYLRELFEVVTRPNVESQIKSASRAFVAATTCGSTGPSTTPHVSTGRRW